MLLRDVPGNQYSLLLNYLTSARAGLKHLLYAVNRWTRLFCIEYYVLDYTIDLDYNVT